MKMKTHKELVKDVKTMGGRCITLETFGSKTFGFVEWKSLNVRNHAEAILEISGYKVDRKYAKGSPYSSVRVSTSEARKLRTFDRWSPYSIEEQ